MIFKSLCQPQPHCHAAWPKPYHRILCFICNIHNKPTKALIMSHIQKKYIGRSTEKQEMGERETHLCLWNLDTRFPMVWHVCGTTQHLDCQTATTETSSEVCSEEESQYLTFLQSMNLGNGGLYVSHSPAVRRCIWLLLVTCVDECVPDKSGGLWATKIRAESWHRRRMESHSLAHWAQNLRHKHTQYTS